jgi:hypothetical protein
LLYPIRISPTTCRLIVILLGAIAVGCSAYTVVSCQFFQLPATTGTVNAVTEEIYRSVTLDGHIGLFSILAADSTDENNDSTCVQFEDLLYLFDTVNWNKVFWAVAQYSSIVAPFFGFTAWTLTIWEFLRGSFCGSFSLPTFLYGMAALIQGEGAEICVLVGYFLITDLVSVPHVSKSPVQQFSKANFCVIYVVCVKNDSNSSRARYHSFICATLFTHQIIIIMGRL